MDDKKFRELVLYLAASKDVDQLGPTKLWKLLYYIDATSLRETGETMTHSDYIRYKHGPVPSCGEKMLKKLKKDDAISTETVNTGKYILNRIIPAKEADTGVFSKDDLGIIAQVVKKYGKETAAVLSKTSHKEPAWKAAPKMEKMSATLMAYGAQEDPDGL